MAGLAPLAVLAPAMAASLLCPIFITLVPRLIMMLPTWHKAAGSSVCCRTAARGSCGAAKQLQKVAYQVDADPDHPSCSHDNSKTSCVAAAADQTRP